ncbi:MAG: CARDB domain-containing protein, partial [Thermoguttaceae bacterium]
MQHTETTGLAVGSSYGASTSAALPGVAPGNYYIIVRTDIRNNVRESDETNNKRTSSQTINMDVPMLTSGVPVTATIQNNQDLYFRINTVAGQDWLLKADFTKSSEAEFYVRYGAPPTRSQFDAVYDNLSDLHQELSISGAHDGSYYVLVHGRQGAGSGAPLTITAEQLVFAVRQVTPASGSNLGQTTVVISGAKFTPAATVALVGAGSTVRNAAKVWWKDSNTLWATFDLTGLATGQYDVRLVDGSNAAIAAGAFTVTNGPVGNFESSVTAPGTIRIGRDGIVTFSYSNSGQTDLAAPIIMLSATNALLEGASETTFTNSVEQFLAINPDGPAGILPPGASGRVSFTFHPTNNQHIHFSTRVMTPSDATLDWASEADASRPSSIAPDAWAAIWSNFSQSVGTTASQFLAVLDDDATYLSQLGEYTSDVSTLTGFELQQANDSLPYSALASVTDLSDAAPGLSLDFSRTYVQPLSGRLALGPLGRGWTDQWDINIAQDADGN